jgi:phospholipid/cholesterol/gamma-HCH transport system substrate-binding protein
MDERKLELKVGVFVTVLLAAGFGVVLLLGMQRQVFEERVRLHATFDDVAGLRLGAPVWLSGVGVGRVTRIAFARATGRDRVRVDLEIARRDLDRVRTDSVARIGSQGLLGDKIVEIAVGSPAAAAVPAGGDVMTEQPADFDKILAQVSDVLEKGQAVARDAATTMHAIADPRTIADVRGTIASLRRIGRAIENGPGLAHALFYDRSTEHEFRSLEHRLNQLAAHVDDGVQKLDRILATTNEDGRNVLNHVARAARSVGDLSEHVRHAQIVTNLDRASADIADMTTAVRNGQGTLGALINDPSVYEQLVTVLGGVARSRILRALVRYAIKRSDHGRDVGRALEAQPPEPPPSLLKEGPREATTPRTKQ